MFQFFVTSSRSFHLFVVQNVRPKTDLGFQSVMLFSSLKRHFGEDCLFPVTTNLQRVVYTCPIQFCFFHIFLSMVQSVQYPHNPLKLLFKVISRVPLVNLMTKSPSHLTWNSTAFKSCSPLLPEACPYVTWGTPQHCQELWCRDIADQFKLWWDPSAEAQADLAQIH